MLGKEFIAAIAADNSVSAYLQYGTIEHLFKGNEAELFTFVQGFVKQFGAIPTLETIETHTGQQFTGGKEPAPYYLELMQQRHIEMTIKQAMKKSSDLLLPDNKDIEQALALLSEAVLTLATQKAQKQIVDVRHLYDLLVPHYVHQLNSDNVGTLKLGFPTFDAMSAGLRLGDMVSICGRPAAGKTYFLLKAALHGWLEALKLFLTTKVETPGARRLFISMEMANLPIGQRIAAMMASISQTQLKHADLSTIGVKKLKNSLIEVKGHYAPFWVVDGNLASTVEEVYLLSRQLKPDAIFIDGGYLLKHPTERDRFRRVAENTDLIKSELCPLAPTVCSWQLSRPKTKGKEKQPDQKVTLDDIGYSDAIGQVSSIVMAMLEDSSVETLIRRKVDVMKGRDGEVGSFMINWDFAKMNFDEIIEQQVSDLQFL